MLLMMQTQFLIRVLHSILCIKLKNIYMDKDKNRRTVILSKSKADYIRKME